jgi:hypothetical protein
VKNVRDVRTYLKSPDFIFTLIGVVVVLTVIAFFFPSESFISSYTTIAYVLIFLSTTLIVLDSKKKTETGATVLLLVALFVVLTCHLLANAFLVNDRLHDHVTIDFSITVQSVIMFNLLIIIVYALILLIFESWMNHKKTRIYLTGFMLILILSMTFFPSLMATTMKEDKAVTVGVTYGSLVEMTLFGNNRSINDTTLIGYTNWTEDFWADEEQIINETNTDLNATGMSELLIDLDETNIGVIFIFDNVDGSPTFEVTIQIDLLNGTILDLIKGTEDIYIPLELVPAEEGTGFVASYISKTVDEIAMEDMGGWGFGKDAVYDVVIYTEYTRFKSFMDEVRKAISDGKIKQDETKDLATDILKENKIIIAPISELYDTENTASSSSRVQQTFANVHNR